MLFDPKKNGTFTQTCKVAIVILGGGLTGEGLIHPHVELRVQHALALYRVTILL